MAASHAPAHAFPDQAVFGGLLIGAGAGLYMITQHRVAGCSGALRAAVASPGGLLAADRAQLGWVAGLVAAGVVMGRSVPTFFEFGPLPLLAAPRLAAAGFATGLGTTWGNGCTSGHGLSGLSRFSVQSLVAVPTFMAAAALTACLASGFAVGPMVPLAPIGQGLSPDEQIPTAIVLFGTVCGALPMFMRTLLPESRKQNAYLDFYAGLWCGFLFGLGLSVGGMARPSAVTGGLSPARFDATLWILFCTALATTFALYRLAGPAGKLRATGGDAACGAPEDGEGSVTPRLIVGASLFGVGWGLSGYCPGPIMVGLGVDPLGGGPLLVATACAVGMRAARPLGTALGLYAPLTLAEEYERLCDGYDAQTGARQITAAVLLKMFQAGDANVVLLDTRGQAEHAVSTLPGARLCETANSAMSVSYKSELPEIPDNDVTVVCHCTAGLRSGWAAVDLEKKWGRPVHSLHGGIVAWSNAGGELQVPGASAEGEEGEEEEEEAKEGMTHRKKKKKKKKSSGDGRTTHLVHTYSGVWGRFLATDGGRKATY
jgi:rhodanese-related sulfurtransferase/uncharacterized membrane protein YedE/YeeE